jgi:ribosomal protein L11 methyltransferase
MRELEKKTGAAIVYEADVDYKDWEAGQNIEPFTIGDLSIAPVWSSEEADIRIDPSVVFGSGFHPTTRMCLESLQLLTGRYQIDSAVDLGCGTGLLAIVAVRLGILQVTAVDYNRLACEVARQNSRRNKVAMAIQQGDLFKNLPDEQSDLLVANLHCELFEHLMNDGRFWKHRYFILSGFRASQEEKLLPLLPTDRVHFLDRGRSEHWAVWLLKAD